MIAYLYTVGHGLWRLNTVLSWQFSRTDGEECEAATITLPYEPEKKTALEHGLRLVLIEGHKAVYVGIFDGFSAVMGKEGQLVTIHSRGMQALLMDNEMRSQFFPVLDAEMVQINFCYNHDVERVLWENMPYVENFYVESGQTAWEVVRGFCRHSTGARPRFSNNGILYLTPPAYEYHSINTENAILRAEYRYNRRGAISRQTIVAYEEDGSQKDVETASYEKIASLQKSNRVTLFQGKNLKASWRTAAQRVEDSVRRGREVVLLLGEAFWAEPGDRIKVTLPQHKIEGQYTLQKITHSLDDTLGRRTELVLEAPL